MKILHVVEATTAGAGQHVIDLGVHMRQAGLDVTVASPRVRDGARRDTAFVDRLGAAGIPAVTVPMRRGIRPWADVRAYRSLLRLMRRNRYDVVHSHSSKAGVLGRLGAWRSGIPASIYTPHAFAFLGARSRGQRWLFLGIEQCLGRRITDALICVSRSEMSLAIERTIAPSARLALVENAIEASRFCSDLDPAEAKASLGLDPGRLVVGYVGRLARQKGIEYLIEAARRVVASGERVQFVLIGEGELERTVQRMLSARHLNAHVKLTGHRTDIPQVLAAIDIFVLPSLYEGLPYTLLEAMAAGRAVLATDVGGNRDLIRHGETGLLVPPRDAPALADGLLRLLNSAGERERLAKAALAEARARPGPAEMTRQVTEVYAQTLERKRTWQRGAPSRR